MELGYQFAYFDGLNRFYVSASQAGLAAAFVCGPNVFDDFALSGTSSAPFCAIFHQRLATDHAAYRRVLDEQRDRLSQHAENLQAAHQVDLDAWDRERASTKEYVDSILSWGRTSEAYAKSLEEERGKLYAAQKESDQRIAFLEESLERCRTTDAAVRK